MPERSLGGRDSIAQGWFGPVVDRSGHLPGALASGFELGEVELPHPVAACRRLYDVSRRSRANWRRSAW